MSRRESPEINAGSMADIAFLLLIFFLVSTTMQTEIGIPKKLSKKNEIDSKIDVNQRNVLEININATNKIMINGKTIVQPTDIEQIAIDFIDNDGGTNFSGEKCTWCNGKKDPLSSEHPDKAIIKIISSRNTSYATYVETQDKVIAAYTSLRNKLSKKLYGITYNELLVENKKQKSNKLEAKITYIKSCYPHHLIEEDPIK